MSLRDKSLPWIQAAAGNVSVRLCTLATGIVLARTLGPSGRGLITIAMLWPGLLLSFGTIVNTQTCTYFASRAGPEGLRACMQGALINGAALFGIALILNWTSLRPEHPELLGAANFYAIAALLMVVAAAFYGGLLGSGRIGAYWSSRIAAPALTAVVVVTLAAAHRLTPTSYIIAVLAGIGASVIIAGSSQRISISNVPTALLGAIVKFGSRVVIASAPSQVNYRIDQFFIVMFLAPAVVGHYVVAVTWASSVSVLGTGFSSVVQSQASRVVGEGRTAVAPVLANIRRAGLVLLAVAIAGIATSTYGLPLLFGKQFAAAVAPAAVLCAANLILNLKLLYQDFARGVGEPALPIVPEIAGGAIRVILLVLLLPWMGAIGAAVASLVSYAAVLMLLWVRLASRIAGVRARDFVPRPADAISST